MTDKQFSSLRAAVVGAALFVGGAVICLEEGFGMLFMLVGGVLLIKDYAVSIWMPGEDADNRAEEKEERKNDTN